MFLNTGRMAVISESRLWIGASDTNREGGWTWSDGSGFTFLNWAPGEVFNKWNFKSFSYFGIFS